MNISSSISQVIYQTRLPGKILLKRACIWPQYNPGRIEKTQRIDIKEPDFNYIKRSSFNPKEYTESIYDSRYTSKGYLENLPYNYTIGSYFEALA
jgi:hypothetical protein